MGAAGLVRAWQGGVTPRQAAIVRLLLVCAAWALGETLVTASSALGIFGVVVPAVLAVGVFALTQDLGRPRVDRDNVRYWRGRRIDDN